MYKGLCLHGRGQEMAAMSAFRWENRVEIYSPLRALAGGAEVSISQPIDSKTKHIICFQSFAEQITITPTILEDNNSNKKTKTKTERNITSMGLRKEAWGKWAFSQKLVLVSPELEGLHGGTVGEKVSVVNSLHQYL